MYATISADIVSSTSLSKNDIIRIKQYVEKELDMLEKKFPSFWGRLIKGDYIECVIPNVCDVLRISLIIKCAIKSFKTSNIKINKEQKAFRTYGIRMAIGIGEMRIVDKKNGIMDGEAIYSSGRTLEKIGPLNKGTIAVEYIKNENLSFTLHTIALLTDALLNNATMRQCEVLYYKLLNYKETDIAKILKISQSGVNEHASAAKWYCIEEALKYFNSIEFK